MSGITNKELSLTPEQCLPALDPVVSVVRSQDSYWMFGRVRGHLNDVVNLFDDVTGGHHGQSAVWTLKEHIQLEKLRKVFTCETKYKVQLV